MRLFLLALDGMFDTGMAVMLDAFGLANKFSVLQTGGPRLFDTAIVGVRRKVRSAHGFSVPVQAVSPKSKPDWVIVPALATGTPEQLIPALARRDVNEAKERLRAWHAGGAHI